MAWALGMAMPWFLTKARHRRTLLAQRPLWSQSDVVHTLRGARRRVCFSCPVQLRQDYVLWSEGKDRRQATGKGEMNNLAKELAAGALALICACDGSASVLAWRPREVSRRRSSIEVIAFWSPSGRRNTMQEAVGSFRRGWSSCRWCLRVMERRGAGSNNSALLRMRLLRSRRVRSRWRSMRLSPPLTVMIEQQQQQHHPASSQNARLSASS